MFKEENIFELKCVTLGLLYIIQEIILLGNL